MGKFINPFTDFGFKHIFGREMDKDILIEFLNDLLEGEHTITDLRIMNNERLPETEQGRKEGHLRYPLRDRQGRTDHNRDAEQGTAPLQGQGLILPLALGGGTGYKGNMGL